MTAVPFQPLQRFGQYVLLRPIAIGGMAEVWLAKLDGPQGFEKKVAVKRMMGTLAEQPQFVSMFLDEARLMSRLTHPNICQVFELGERDDSFYVAMEFIDGQTVQHMMRAVTRAKQRLPVELALKIARDAADALHYAHSKRDEQGQPLGIIHRDVSPQNLMVTYEGVPKLLDFGIAKAATRSNATEAGQLKGKLSYMPPEQARGDQLDPRADQFSLGVTLFEMLTHTRLYPPLKEMDLFRLVGLSNDPYPLAIERDPTVPAELSELVARMMARGAEHRFASMAEVRDRLTEELHERSQTMPSSEALVFFMSSHFPPETREQVSQGQATPVPMVPGEFSDARVLQRRSKVYLLGAAAAVTLIGAIALAFFLSSPVPTQALLPRVEAPAPIVDASPVIAVIEPLPELNIEPEQEPVPPVVPDEPEPVKTTKRVVKGTGKLSLQTSPWSNVYFGKKNLGETPLVGAPLPAGRQRLTLVNEERKLRKTIEVDIKPNETTTLKLKL